MAKLPSSKRLQIDKANTTMMVSIAVASFLVVFSLVASKSLLSQRAYQSRVIAKKEKARDQLKTNIENSQKLVTAYQAFVGGPSNVIGGASDGKSDRDGDNAKIMLDALPSTYDFPALASSIDKLLGQDGIKIESITGTDEEVTQQKTAEDATTSGGAAVPIPFQATVSGNYQDTQKLFAAIERSIRPIQIQIINISGGNSDMKLALTAQTFYKPAVQLKVSTEEVK